MSTPTRPPDSAPSPIPPHRPAGPANLPLPRPSGSPRPCSPARPSRPRAWRPAHSACHVTLPPLARHSCPAPPVTCFTTGPPTASAPPPLVTWATRPAPYWSLTTPSPVTWAHRPALRDRRPAPHHVTGRSAPCSVPAPPPRRRAPTCPGTYPPSETSLRGRRAAAAAERALLGRSLGRSATAPGEDGAARRELCDPR